MPRYEKCPNCGEDILKLDNFSVQHRYNYKAECPDNSGKEIYVRPDGNIAARPNDVPASVIGEATGGRADKGDGKADGQGKGEGQSEGEGSGEGEGEGKNGDKDGKGGGDGFPPPLMFAVGMINQLWRDRIQERGYAPTDEELAEIVVKFVPQAQETK